MCLSLTFSCGHNSKSKLTKDELLITILDDSLAINDYQRYKRIYILTEQGCLNCNKSYSQFIQNELDDSSLCIVNAQGHKIDVSPFLESKKKNVVFDYDNFFIRNKMISNSAYILFDGKKIDTLFEIEAKSLFQQFKIMDYHLNGGNNSY